MAKKARSKGPKKAETPLKWYTFYSEKAGREYYYEPINRVATWVLPDDAHPYPSQSESTTEPSVVEKRVSFHDFVEKTVDSTEAHGSRSFEQVENRSLPSCDSTLGLSARKKWILALLFTAVLAAAIALCGRSFIRQDVLKVSSSDGRFGKQHPTEMTSSSLGQNLATVENEDLRPTISSLKRKATTLSFGTKETVADQSKKARQQAIDGDSLHARTIPSPDPRKGPKKEEGYVTREEDDSESACSSETSGSEQIKTDIRQGKTRSPHNRECLVPFAYVFSRKCRRLATEKPVFDLKGIVDSMIE